MTATELQLMDNSMVPAAGAQRVQTQYATAMSVQLPRVLAQVESRACEEAALIGADGYYAWGAGKDRVEGPSVGLAMTLVRCFGNCAIDMEPVQDLPDAWVFTAKFIDLETGFTLPRQFRQSKKWTVYGKFDAERKDDIRFQIGQSKAVRNVVLNAVPKWLVSRALDKCKGGVRETLENAIASHGMEEVVSRAMKSLDSLGASEERVLLAMGRNAVGALTLEDLVIIKGSIAALESGADTVDAIFPAPGDIADKPDKSTERTRALTDQVKKGKGKGKKEEPAEADEPKDEAGQRWADLVEAQASHHLVEFDEADARLRGYADKFFKTEDYTKFKPAMWKDIEAKVAAGDIPM